MPTSTLSSDSRMMMVDRTTMERDALALVMNDSLERMLRTCLGDRDRELRELGEQLADSANEVRGLRERLQTIDDAVRPAGEADTAMSPPRDQCKA